MSSTITYKGETLATAENNTKVLKTAGKYLEDDVTITDVTSGGGTMQTKSVSYTPSESSQSGTVTPDTGYDGLSSVSVSVGAISSDYVGSGVTRRSSSDLTASDATVSVPAGYYENAASKTIVSGRPGTPIAGKSPVSNLHTITITPSVSNSAGWIPSGMIVGEDVTVSASELVSGTLNVTSSGTKDVTNYASASIPAGSATASATKGTVSNHSVSVTPSVTKSAGWINTGSSNGPAVTVSASELDSGTKSITQNGTGIDVVGYAAVDVAVSGGADMPTFTLNDTMTSVTCDKTFAECLAYVNDDIVTALVDTPYGPMTAYNVEVISTQLRYIISDPIPEADIVYNSNGTLNLVMPSTYRETLSVTQNGTYYPTQQNKAITEVTVNVPSSQPTLQTKSKTYTPTTSQQTESVTADNGYDGLSAVNVTVNAMPTMTLPSAASASYTGTEQAVIRPSANNQYINIPTGYNGAAKFYEFAPMMLDSKTITQNGTYLAGDDDLHGFSSVTVNVSGGVAVGVADIYNSSQNSTITFTGLLGEPTSFTILCGEQTLATGASPYKTAAVVYDGVNDKVQRITNTSNAQMTYQAQGAYHLYENGQLFVACTDSTQFVQGDYYLIYTYGGGAGNIGTSLVQVGSGATSIQFTGLPDEPIYWSCMFTSNIGTSSGYTRAHVIASGDNFFGGREMGSGSEYCTSWTSSYSNGTLTITSQSTSQGGYFHQPGYYQLTYAIAGDGQITTEPLSVTQNGTYTAPFGTAYTPVTVNVAGSSKNAQVVQGTTRTTSSTLTAIGAEMTVSKTGTYDVYWSAFRSNTSTQYTFGTQLYINGTAYGTEQTGSWSNHVQNIHLSNVSLTQNQTLRVYGRESRGSSYYMYAPMLTIVEA